MIDTAPPLTRQAAADAQAAAAYRAAHRDEPPCLIVGCPVCRGETPPPPCWECIDGRACRCEQEARGADAE